MDKERWVSLNQFMKLRNIGYETAMDMINNNEVEYHKSDGNKNVRYKIKIGGDTVSREVYEEEKAKRIKAETTLNLLKKVLEEEN